MMETDPITIRDVIEGQTAGHLIVAADDYGWWTDLLAGHPVHPTSGTLEAVVADALIRAGMFSETPRGIALTDTGREAAESRGFVRMVVRGWEPTFRRLGEHRTEAYIPAATEADEVARGCTDVAYRRPEILGAIGKAIDSGTTGATIDLGCANAGRIIALSQLAPDETFVGVDIEAEVIDDATRNVEQQNLAERITLRAGSVHPGSELPTWLQTIERDSVTTAMSFFLLHQLASDGDGLTWVLQQWMRWFPRLERLVIGDGLKLTAPRWEQQPWFSPSYEVYHQATGVRLWTAEEYDAAFTELGWRIADRHTDHTIAVTTVLERA